MKKIKVSFSSNWISKNRDKYGNIPRKTWKDINADIPEAVLVQLGVSDMQINMPDEAVDNLGELIDNILTGKFSTRYSEAGINMLDMADGTNIEYVSGTSIGGEMISTETKEAEPEKAEEVKPEAKETEPAKTEEVKPEEKESEPAKTEDVKTEETEPAKPEIKETKVEKKAEAKPEEKENASVTEVAEEEAEIYSRIPIKHSQNLKDFIAEFISVIEAMKNLHIEDVIWSENILLAINTGYGFERFAKAVEEVLKDNKLFDSRGEAITVFELRGINSDKDEEYQEVIDNIKSYVRAKKSPIVAIDISSCMYELTSERAKIRLQALSSICKERLIIFRIPCVEMFQIEMIKNCIGDVMSVKEVVSHPASITDMVSYMTDVLSSKGFYITDAGKECIEQLIIDDKKDGSFWGYDSLDVLVDRIQYEKAYSNSKSGSLSRTIDNLVFDRLLGENNTLNSDPYELLSELIGMAEVKTKIREIVAQIKLQEKLVSEGKELERPCIHMMFTGGPGTGKTTVARIVAQILKKEGILERGHFFEIKGRDLCGRYVGETTPKTAAICRDAYGSVLFIDEAYALDANSDRDYGREAITALVAEMENHKSEMCVILAGYSEDMNNLLALNAGLKSRIPYIIDFPNYSREELAQIFFKLVDGKFEYEEAVKEELMTYLNSISDSKMESRDFGNGRFIRNLYERVWGKTAYRWNVEGNKGTPTISCEDFKMAVSDTSFSDMSKTERKLGF